MNNDSTPGTESPQCRICRQPASDAISDEAHSYHVCLTCAEKHLGRYPDAAAKIAAMDTAVALATMERTPLAYALNVVNCVCGLGKMRRRMVPRAAPDHKSKPKSGNCRICRRPTRDFISNGSRMYHLCADCDRRHFRGYRNPAVKADILASAINLANAERIGLAYALNVETGLYNLEEAKRRISLKNQDRGKSSTDIFIVSRRMPGSFK